jgi:hypothetical protein
VVIDHYTVTHVYYIPLGSGRFVQSMRQCQNCSSELSCRIEDYVDILETDVASSLSTDQILRNTNPRLAETVEAKEQSRNAILQAWDRADPGGEADSQWSLASLRFDEMGDFDQETSRLRRRLEEWSRLSGEERNVLLKEIDSLEAECVLERQPSS